MPPETAADFVLLRLIGIGERFCVFLGVRTI